MIIQLVDYINNNLAREKNKLALNSVIKIANDR